MTAVERRKRENFMVSVRVFDGVDCFTKVLIQ